MAAKSTKAKRAERLLEAGVRVRHVSDHGLYAYVWSDKKATIILEPKSLIRTSLD